MASSLRWSVLGVLIFIQGWSSVRSDDDWPERPAFAHWGGSDPVPDNAMVSLSADKAEYFLGENVLVHFTVENVGGPAFNVDSGGDYRGAARALRFEVVAQDQHGNTLADPYPCYDHMGGIGGPTEVTPDNPFYASVRIVRYARFERPGTYFVRVRHDCGWKATESRPLPEGKIVLRFREPTEAEARNLVVDWLSQPPFTGVLVGKKSPPHPDFTQISFGAYLPALAEAAREGNAHAIEGVGSVATPEATRALIDLINSGSEEVAGHATDQLRRRIPHHLPRHDTQEPNADKGRPESHTAWLVRTSWRDEFAPDVREIAVRLLASGETETVDDGAYLMGGIGVPEDISHLVAALNSELPKTGLKTEERNIYYRRRSVCWRLDDALERLIERGASVPVQPSSPGEVMLFLAGLRTDHELRPAGWIETCDAALKSHVAYVQERALESLPQPFPEELHQNLPALLESNQHGVATAACRIIGRDKLTQFRKPVLSTLRRAKDDWLFRAASQAAIEIGAEQERLEILVSRLDEPGMLYPCLNALRTVFDNVGGGGWNTNIDVAAEAKRIKPKWEKLLVDHAEYLQSGKRFTLPNPDISSDMFPEQFTMTLRVGATSSTWPEDSN